MSVTTVYRMFSDKTSKYEPFVHIQLVSQYMCVSQNLFTSCLAKLPSVYTTESCSQSRSSDK